MRVRAGDVEIEYRDAHVVDVVIGTVRYGSANALVWLRVCGLWIVVEADSRLFFNVDVMLCVYVDVSHR